MNNIKIDLVYLWCDGNDDALYQKRNKYLKLYKKLDPQSSTSARWQDNDELKYSLRSVEKFAPWINHIYIVTDNQIPQWLNTKHPKITIVDHKDIIPQKYLPTFNSSVIELFIQNIKGLSEYFLYANDDMMFGKKTSYSFFFDKNNNPIVDVKNKYFKYNIFTNSGLEKSLQSTKSLFNRWIIKNLRKIFDIYGKKYLLQPAHNIEAFRKSYLIENLNDKAFKDLFEKTKESKFREENNIQRFIFPLMDNAKGRNTLRINLKCHWWEKFLNKSFYTIVISNRKSIKKINTYKPNLFCINEDEKTTDKKRKENKKFLDKFFNKKSKFEV